MSPSFGHSNGVNLANYRLLQQSSRNQKTGYCSPHEWNLESIEQINMGASENKLSSTLRQASTALQNQTTAIVQADLYNVDSALKSKLSQTELLKNALDQSLRDVVNETNELAMLRSKLEVRLSRVNQKLDLAANRQQVRGARPARERTMDEVEKTLLSQQGLLSSFADKVKRAITQVDREVSQLDGVRNRLEADLRDKVDALRVDEAVLNIPPEAYVEGTMSSQWASSRSGMDGAMKTPHTWTRGTEENVRNAQHWMQDSQRLRKAVHHAVASSRAAEQDLSDVLNTRMLTKVGATRRLREDLERELERVRDEQSRAALQRHHLISSLEAKKGPLAQAKERLSVRKSRPTRENVADEVEAALAQEVAHLASVTASLSHKVASVDKELEALDLTSAMLFDNIRDKDVALEVDERVVMLDGRLNITNAPPRSVASIALSDASPARTMTLQRIRELESSLVNARRERENLENSVRQLKDTYA